MEQRSVVVFCMPETGHYQRLHSVIAMMSGLGFPVRVLTHRAFQRQVEGAGATFIDLFARYPLEQADSDSMPVPCRYVSFAGHFADDMCRAVAALSPSLIIHDSFALIGRVVAGRLGIPHINICSGHNVTPARFLDLLERDPRVRLSDDCRRAVEILRNRYGIADASPFSYTTSISRSRSPPAATASAMVENPWNDSSTISPA